MAGEVGVDDEEDPPAPPPPPPSPQDPIPSLSLQLTPSLPQTLKHSLLLRPRSLSLLRCLRSSGRTAGLLEAAQEEEEEEEEEERLRINTEASSPCGW